MLQGRSGSDDVCYSALFRSHQLGVRGVCCGVHQGLSPTAHTAQPWPQYVSSCCRVGPEVMTSAIKTPGYIICRVSEVSAAVSTRVYHQLHTLPNPGLYMCPHVAG